MTLTSSSTGNFAPSLSLPSSFSITALGMAISCCRKHSSLRSRTINPFYNSCQLTAWGLVDSYIEFAFLMDGFVKFLSVNTCEDSFYYTSRIVRITTVQSQTTSYIAGFSIYYQSDSKRLKFSKGSDWKAFNEFFQCFGSSVGSLIFPEFNKGINEFTFFTADTGTTLMGFTYPTPLSARSKFTTPLLKRL